MLLKKLANIPHRFMTNFKDPKLRRNVAMLMLGKMLGLMLVLFLMNAIFPMGGAVEAQDAAATAEVAQTNAINTVWTLVAAFLVFGMQAGFVMLEAGFARSREAVNIMVEGIADTFICGITFWIWGYAFMFQPGSPFIGTQGFFLQNLHPDWGGATGLYGLTGIPVLAHWVFQFAFADTTSTITSGAMIGRCDFKGDLIYSVCVTGFIYPIVGHWAWGPDGWLALMQPLPFRDFAGSTVVHSIGGAISLAGAIALGPRLGRIFKRDGGGPMKPHDLIIGAVGGLILWFGWYGFNPGSTLSAMDIQGIGRVAFNTTLAACSAGMTALLISYATSKKWDLGFTVNGFLAGLVAITAPCYWVEPTGAFFIGIVGGFVLYLATEALEYLRIDDPIGAVPVHLANGIWGTLAIGLFASGQFGLPTPLGADNSFVVTGLLYGGGLGQFGAQVIGSAAVVATTFAASMVIFMLIKGAGLLRVSPEGELIGLDIYEHGASAYPEFVVSGNDGTPAKKDPKAAVLPAGSATASGSGD
ncbi:MAG: ammonium transporter [Anaerolineae bacterium]|nr:ammonium transporter [Anaerolineae bacterium]